MLSVLLVTDWDFHVLFKLLSHMKVVSVHRTTFIMFAINRNTIKTRQIKTPQEHRRKRSFSACRKLKETNIHDLNNSNLQAGDEKRSCRRQKQLNTCLVQCHSQSKCIKMAF